LAGNDTLFGMGGNDNLLGGAGDDWIDGGSGNDTMSGSTGNDTFVVDSVGDVVSESVNAGIDLVRSSVSWTLGANFENLTLTGMAAINATGNTLNNELTGNAAANILTGGAGNDTLSGGGGNDTLDGGTGIDTAVMGGTRAEHNIVRTGDDAYTVTRSPGEVQTLLNVEFAQFNGPLNIALTTGGLSLTDDTPTVGQALSVSNTLANSQSLSITGTQWQVLDAGNWQAIAGATDSSFTPGAAQVGKALRVAVSFDDPIGIGQIATSAATSAVVADDTNTPPTGSPVIVGSAVEDQVLVVDTGTIADIDGLGSFSYQWLRNASTVGTGVSYVLGDADVGQPIQVRVSYIDGASKAEVLTSQATAPVTNVNDAPLGAVTISGSAVIGATLVASHTVTDADGMPNPVSYRWQSSINGSTWTDIAGASAANFTVADSQLVGSLLRVRMSFVDGFGTAETVNSSATAAVAGSSVINGTAAADNLVGTVNDDQIYGFGGNDTLAGGLGKDTLDGGSGNDTMSGGPGDDTYFVDSLNDVIVENAAEGIDLVVSGSVTLTLGNNIENATLVGSAGIGVYGNGLDNVITGNSAGQWIQGLAGNDTLFGMGGNDNLLGGAGDDWIDGGSGNDTMSGSTGNDTLRGGTGVDSLEGGTGNDVFDFDDISESGVGVGLRDIIADFVQGQDRIDLNTIDANSGSSGNQDFSFIGTADFSAAAQVRYFTSAGSTILQANIGGSNNNVVDFEIQLTGTFTLLITDLSL
jgi:Ca2+-binding RTX toxin-like protein